LYCRLARGTGTAASREAALPHGFAFASVSRRELAHGRRASKNIRAAREIPGQIPYRISSSFSLNASYFFIFRTM
jgi:hypothetical protein